jgi:hypothetical protein
MSTVFIDAGENIGDENIQSLELSALIDEVENQLVHLRRSQDELILALQDDPNDQDFLDAVSENTVIIARKQESVDKMKEELRRVNIAFEVQRRKAALLLERSAAAESAAAAAAADSLTSVAVAVGSDSPIEMVSSAILPEQTTRIIETELPSTVETINDENGIYL